MTNSSLHIGDYIIDLMRKDKNIYLLFADGTFTSFTKNFKIDDEIKDRFINVGISEQNMVSLAAGLALSGKIPYLIMLSTFMTTRAAEQLKLDVCYNNANVKLIALNGGFADIIKAGYSHFAMEDIAFLNALPNIEIFCTINNKNEVQKIIEHSYLHKGPVYIRLNAQGKLYDNYNYDVELYRLSQITEGTKTAIISIGYSFQTAKKLVNEIMSKEKYVPSLFSAHCLKPFDEKGLLQILKKYKNIITIEEHAKGGLASIVAEIIAKSNKKVNFLPIYAKCDNYNFVARSNEYAQEKIFNVSNIYNAYKSAKPIKQYFLFSKYHYFNSKYEEVTGFLVLSIPLLKFIKRNKVKKGKLLYKVYILGIRIL